MGNQCQVSSDTFCNVVAQNLNPISGTFPKYKGESGVCVPQSCTEGYEAALTDYYKGVYCGAKWQSPDCVVSVSCWWTPTASLLFPILGGVLAFFVLAGCLLVGWALWDKRRARLRAIAEGRAESLVDSSDDEDDDEAGDDRDGGGGGGRAERGITWAGQREAGDGNAAARRDRRADEEAERDSNSLLINYGEDGL
jgi:hypothetical protein